MRKMRSVLIPRRTCTHSEYQLASRYRAIPGTHFRRVANRVQKVGLIGAAATGRAPNLLRAGSSRAGRLGGLGPGQCKRMLVMLGRHHAAQWPAGSP